MQYLLISYLYIKDYPIAMKTAVILVRVSTDIQDFEPQLEDLVRYAENLGFTKLHRIQTKESGLADLKDKKGLNELFSFLESNQECKTIFATELSRLARRQSILHEIKEWLVKKKVQLYLKDSGYALLDDTGNVSISGELMFSLYGLFAESEIKTKKERFSRARKYWMERGISIGGKTLFGYERVEIENNKTTLRIHNDNADTVKKIFHWYLYGIDKSMKNPSIKNIALHCLKIGKPEYTHSKRNINKLLKEKAYTGEKITNNKRKNPNYASGASEERYVTSNNRIIYPRIIDIELFDAVQLKLKSNNTQADKSTKHTTLLSRKIKCHVCGNFFISEYRLKQNQDKSTYRCGSRSRVKGCSNKWSISLTLLDSAVWGLIFSDLESLKKVYLTETPNQKLNELLKEKENLQNSLLKINELIESFKTNLQRYNTPVLVEAAFNEVNKQVKKREALEKKIREIDADIYQMQNDINDMDFIGMNDIINTKYLVKKYIDLFVKDVQLQFHSARYTVIRVSFMKTSQEIIHGRRNPNLPDGIIEPINTIVLDKRLTQSVKAFSITSYVRIVANRMQIQIPNGIERVGNKLITNYMSVNLDDISSTPNSLIRKFMLNKVG